MIFPAATATSPTDIIRAWTLTQRANLQNPFTRNSPTMATEGSLLGKDQCSLGSNASFGCLLRSSQGTGTEAARQSLVTWTCFGWTRNSHNQLRRVCSGSKAQTPLFAQFANCCHAKSQRSSSAMRTTRPKGSERIMSCGWKTTR